MSAPTSFEYKPEKDSGELQKLLESLAPIASSVQERLDWNDQTFSTNFITDAVYKLPSETDIKPSALSLIGMMSGTITNLIGLHEDMLKIIISMNHPRENEMLFKYAIGTTNTKDIPKRSQNMTDFNIDGIAASSYNPHSNQPLSDQNTPDTVLAGDVVPKDTPPAEPQETLTMTKIKTGWEQIYTAFKELKTQGDVENRGCVNWLGMYCLYLIKSMVRSPDVVFTSIQQRLVKHCATAYPLEVPFDLVPPSIEFLTKLSVYVESNRKSMNTILALLIGRFMIETAAPSPDPTVRGILMGSCLMHTCMQGLPTLKHLEQAHIATKIPMNIMCLLVYNDATKGTLDFISQLIKHMDKKVSVTIKGKSYQMSQISWRWSRLFNDAFFARLGNSQDILIIKCVAYIGCTEKEINLIHEFIEANTHYI